MVLARVDGKIGVNPVKTIVRGRSWVEVVVANDHRRLRAGAMEQVKLIDVCVHFRIFPLSDWVNTRTCNIFKKITTTFVLLALHHQVG